MIKSMAELNGCEYHELKLVPPRPINHAFEICLNNKTINELLDYY